LGICGGGDDGGQEEKEEEEDMKEERGRCCASSFACGHDAMANSGAVKMGWHRRLGSYFSLPAGVEIIMAARAVYIYCQGI
jgi:methenyltetrahydromethanopterin cyclohydrolase